jgi:hypothetical protein
MEDKRVTPSSFQGSNLPTKGSLVDHWDPWLYIRKVDIKEFVQDLPRELVTWQTFRVLARRCAFSACSQLAPLLLVVLVLYSPSFGRGFTDRRRPGKGG